jgi:hypothetical protein
MQTYEIAWRLSGRSKVEAATPEDAIERIELMETFDLLNISQTESLEIREVGEI